MSMKIHGHKILAIKMKLRTFKTTNSANRSTVLTQQGPHGNQRTLSVPGIICTKPLSTRQSRLFWKTEILLLFLRISYFKPGFQVLGGIVSFPVSLLFSAVTVLDNKAMPMSTIAPTQAKNMRALEKLHWPWASRYIKNDVLEIWI